MRNSLSIRFAAAVLACFFLRETPVLAFGSDDAAAIAASGPVALGGMLKGSPVWRAYRARFVTDAGRVVDTANGAFSHSEGQGYGLLLAAAAADRKAFDKILTWTTLNLHVRGDKLAAWRWTGSSPAKQDKHNATDGDVLIAWALAEAADLWNDPRYLRAAEAMTADIVAKLVKPTRDFGPVLMPGAEGFGPRERPDGPVVNLSYWVFPAFYRLAQIWPSFDWNALVQSGLDLMQRAQVGPSKPPPDWLSLGRQEIAPAQGFDNAGYDALRIPLYLIWADAATRERLGVFDVAWPAETAGAGRAEPGYQAVAALLRCETQGAPYPATFYRFSESQYYYPATLHLLSLIAATMRGGSCLDRDEMSRILSHNWRPRIGSLARLEPLLKPAAALAPATREGPPTENGADRRKNSTSANEDFLTGNGDMLKDADLLSYLRIIAGAGTVLAGFYYLFNRVGDENAGGQSDESATPTGSGWRPAPGQYAIVPRTLPKNPFTDATNLATLGDGIEAAAAESVRLSRTVGLIYFEFPSLAGFEQEHGVLAADDAMIALAEDFRRAVRPTDHVAILNRNQIVVAICLLAGRKDLETISSRLSAAARRRGLIEADAPSLPVGLAIYPLDGYGGLELIESARRRYRELRPDALYEAEAESQEQGSRSGVDATPARKRSRRGPAGKSQTPQPAA